MKNKAVFHFPISIVHFSLSNQVAILALTAFVDEFQGQMKYGKRKMEDPHGREYRLAYEVLKSHEFSNRLGGDEMNDRMNAAANRP